MHFPFRLALRQKSLEGKALAAALPPAANEPLPDSGTRASPNRTHQLTRAASTKCSRRTSPLEPRLTTTHRLGATYRSNLMDAEFWRTYEFLCTPRSRAFSSSRRPSSLTLTLKSARLIHNILDPKVWSVRHAADNKAALALVKASPFDLILTSDKTSGKDDIELLRKIRLVRPHTRLIILTDESAPSYVIDSMRERAFSYFSRPFSLTALADMVQNAIEGPCWDDGIEVLSATPEWIRLLARCDLKTADRLIQFLHEIADLPEEEGNAVAIGLSRNPAERDGVWRTVPARPVGGNFVRSRASYGDVPREGSGGRLFA